LRIRRPQAQDEPEAPVPARPGATNRATITSGRDGPLFLGDFVLLRAPCAVPPSERFMYDAYRSVVPNKRSTF